MKWLNWVLPPFLLAVGCHSRSDSMQDPAPTPPPAAAVAPDNTGVNTRDRGDKTQTTVDQGESQDEVDVTARIRRQIVQADDFSVNAQNVKIITEGMLITLRGPVASADEKERIDKIARQQAGELFQVDNQLEIAP